MRVRQSRPLIRFLLPSSKLTRGSLPPATLVSASPRCNQLLASPSTICDPFCTCTTPLPSTPHHSDAFWFSIRAHLQPEALRNIARFLSIPNRRSQLPRKLGVSSLVAVASGPEFERTLFFDFAESSARCWPSQRVYRAESEELDGRGRVSWEQDDVCLQRSAAR